MIKRIIGFLPFLVLVVASYSFYGQNTYDELFYRKVDSLLVDSTVRPFNGVILIATQDSVTYHKTYGYSDYALKQPMKLDHRFVIGSLSKQITAVLIMKEYEQGRLNLTDSIGKFLPEIEMPWTSLVTVHHLLSHTHGITDLNKALDFTPGVSFSYSNLGYQILGEILEKVTGKTYVELANRLFISVGMMNSTANMGANHNSVGNAYYRDSQGSIHLEKDTFINQYAAAATLISTTEDLLLWNHVLHNGEIISTKNYDLMITPHANQNHSLFGIIGYGYGLRIANENDILEIGHTGYVPGYVSMNLYYPDSKTSLIMLENVDWKD